MKARRLKITPDLWVEILKRDTPFKLRIAKNALPADAKCIGLEETFCGEIFSLWITSEAFRDDDPTDLPYPQIRVVDGE